MNLSCTSIFDLSPISMLLNTLCSNLIWFSTFKHFKRVICPSFDKQIIEFSISLKISKFLNFVLFSNYNWTFLKSDLFII